MEIKNILIILYFKNHSLIDMAFQPKEMENAKLNADGFGIVGIAKKMLNFFYIRTIYRFGMTKILSL